MNLQVGCIRVGKQSRRKNDGLLMEYFGRGNGGAFGGKKYSLCESRTHQVDLELTAIPTLECWSAKIYIIDLDSLRDDVLCQVFQK